MRYILSLLYLSVTLITFGQNRGYSRLVVSATQQQYLDKYGVKTDNIQPNDNILPNDPNCRYYSVEYRRTTRYGWVFGAGLHAGVRKYDVGIYDDLSFFDPLAKNDLGGLVYQRRIVANIRYWGPRVFAGYRLKLNDKWAVVSTLGVSFKFFTQGVQEGDITKFVIYMLDNTTAVNTEPFIQEDFLFGRGPVFNHGLFKTNYFNGHKTCADFYLGVQRNVHIRWLKNLELGVEASRLLSFKTWRSMDASSIGAPEMTVLLRPDVSVTDERDFSKDKFVDRNISFGIRLGLGLWR